MDILRRTSRWDGNRLFTMRGCLTAHMMYSSDLIRSSLWLHIFQKHVLDIVRCTYVELNLMKSLAHCSKSPSKHNKRLKWKIFFNKVNQCYIALLYSFDLSSVICRFTSIVPRYGGTEIHNLKG
jgi:hypothetical protein